MPSQPNAPTTTTIGETTIVVDWNPPSDLGGLTITSYKLEIKTSTSTFEIDLADCDAESSTATTCSVPVATLRAAPFNLADLASVSVRVTAINSLGDSTVSVEGNGAIMPIPDTVPAAPSVFSTDSQSTTSISFSWTEPADGGDTITDYEIDWNQGDSINSFTPLTTTTSGSRTKTVSGLTVDGEVYRFRVRAINTVGTSTNSAEY